MIENENLTAPDAVMPDELQRQLNERYQRDLEGQQRQQQAVKEELSGHVVLADDLVEPKPLSDAERGAAIAARTMMDPLGSNDDGFLKRVKNSILSKFIGEHREEFEAMEAKELARQTVRTQFANMVSKLDTDRQNLAALQAEVAAHKDLNVAAGAFTAMKNSGRSLFQIFAEPSISAQVSIKTYGPEILKLAEKSLLDLEREFSDFKKKNSAFLKAEGLI